MFLKAADLALHDLPEQNASLRFVKGMFQIRAWEKITIAGDANCRRIGTGLPGIC